MKSPRSLLAGTAALLIGSAGICLGMGSGPHPHLLIGAPHDTDAAGAQGALALVGGGEGLGLLLAAATVGLMIWAVKLKTRV